MLNAFPEQFQPLFAMNTLRDTTLLPVNVVLSCALLRSLLLPDVSETGMIDALEEGPPDFGGRGVCYGTKLVDVTEAFAWPVLA